MGSAEWKRRFVQTHRARPSYCYRRSVMSTHLTAWTDSIVNATPVGASIVSDFGWRSRWWQGSPGILGDFVLVIT